VFVFIPLTWFLLWKYKLPKAIPRALGQLAGAALIYSAITIAVHGSLFWPQVGSYVLFSGANEYTAQEMERSYNDAAEGSLVPALKLRGIDAYHDWSKPDNLPGDNEVRNPKFARLYNHEALLFMRRHPGTMVKLTGFKLFVLLRPDLYIHKAKSVGGAIKIFSIFALPTWIVLCFVLPHPRNDPSRLIIGLTILFFLAPHLLTVAAPRFRISVDVLCFIDIAAMLIVWRRGRVSKTRGHVKAAALPA